MKKELFFACLCLFSFTLQAELFFTPEMIESHLKSYNEEEKALIQKDLCVIRDICIDDLNVPKRKIYLATAGGPGARKTTILERFVNSHPEYQGGVYIDPDQRALKLMVNTYYVKGLNSLLIAESNDYNQVIINAYQKWRGGSNYIALTLLEEAFERELSIIHGTTSTGNHILPFYKSLRKNNYKIVLLLCSCEDPLRYEAVDYRNKEIRFYQNSPEDAINKGLLFSEKMAIYFTEADELYLYWSDSLFSSERLAAFWKAGVLEILDIEALQRFVNKYETDRAQLEEQGKSIPSFDSFILEKKHLGHSDE